MRMQGTCGLRVKEEEGGGILTTGRLVCGKGLCIYAADAQQMANRGAGKVCACCGPHLLLAAHGGMQKRWLRKAAVLTCMLRASDTQAVPESTPAAAHCY